MRNRLLALVAALLLAAGSLSAAVFPFSSWTIGVASGWERTAAGDAVPVVGNSVFSLGIGITSSSFAFAYAEAGFDAPDVCLSSFTSCSVARYGSFGFGWCSFFGKDFSLALRTGLVNRYYGNDAGLSIGELGISAAIVPRIKLFSVEEKPVGYGIEMPVTVVYYGDALSVTVGCSVFFDVSSSYL